jgi:DNA-binding response OmpR family regulator
MPATILVVEDEPAIQELIAYNLKQAGHQHDPGRQLQNRR